MQFTLQGFWHTCHEVSCMISPVPNGVKTPVRSVLEFGFLLGFGVWSLELLWSLVLGIWSFLSTSALPDQSPPTTHQSLRPRSRSEEHTSELQSRFGISYAVFC